jgi:putative methyltransferase (TIGR04325 family)
MSRALVSDLTPPLLFRTAQRVRLRARGFGAHTFEGCYPTLADVPTGAGYDDDELADRLAANGLRELSNDRAAMDDGRGRHILPLIVSGITERPLTVIDFGGGAACVGLRCILSHAPHFDLGSFSYVLVETPALCRKLRGAIDKPFVTVADTIPDAPDGTLVVNLSGSLQYVTDWRAALHRLASLKPKVMIVSLTSFSEAPTYARMQANIAHHRRIACWVFNRADFLGEMAQAGYRLDFHIEHDLPVTYCNAPSPPCFASMVFSRF